MKLQLISCEISRQLNLGMPKILGIHIDLACVKLYRD